VLGGQRTRLKDPVLLTPRALGVSLWTGPDRHGPVAQTRSVDESFLALPLSALTEAALTRAVDLGCEHAELRVERIRTQTVRLRDARLEALADGEDLGLAVRVVHEGTWGFAAGVVLTAAEAVRLAEEAVAVARVSAAMNTDRVELAPEPVYPGGDWVSA
jgi:TldD protein